MADQTNQSSNGHSKMSGKATVATMAGVAGAVVGAGVAVAAATALSDKGTREKVKQTFNKVKSQVMDTIHEEQKKMNSASDSGQKNLKSGKSRSAGSSKEQKPVNGMHVAG